MNGTQSTTYAYNLKYGAAGLLLSGLLANGGVTETLSYYWLGQMTQLDLTKTDLSHPLTLTWDYGSTGDTGNLLSHGTNTGTRTFNQYFGYDGASRLRMEVEKATVNADLNSASTTCSSITAGTWPAGERCLRFGYDGFGNGWNEENQNASGLRFQGHNWYVNGTVVSNRINGMEYDAAGHLRQLEPANALSPVANYDGEGRIYELGTRTTSSPSAPVTATAQYYYNGEGQRVKRVVSGVTTYYVYGVDGALAQEYTDGTATMTGQKYLIADNLGSTRLMLDGATLQTVARYDYEPYGVLISRTGEGYDTAPGGSQLLFTGKERDLETAGGVNPSGLDYFGARYMSAAQGRFTSADPYVFQFAAASHTRDEEEQNQLRDRYISNPQVWNKYAYGLNNPLKFVDPTGRCSKPSGQKEGETGICIEAFIAKSWFKLVGRGDGRTFSGTDASQTARSRIKLTVDGKGNVTSQSVESARSGVVVKGMGLQGDTVAKVESKGNQDGSVSLHVSLWGRNGEAGIPGAPKGVLEGNFNLNISKDGNVTLLNQGSSATTFPSWGIYGYGQSGGVQTVKEIPENKIEDLQKPAAPIK